MQPTNYLGNVTPSYQQTLTTIPTTFDEFVGCLNNNKIPELITLLNRSTYAYNDVNLEFMLYNAFAMRVRLGDRQFNAILSTASYQVNILAKTVISALQSGSQEGVNFLNYLLDKCKANTENAACRGFPNLLVPVLQKALELAEFDRKNHLTIEFLKNKLHTLTLTNTLQHPVSVTQHGSFGIENAQQKTHPVGVFHATYQVAAQPNAPIENFSQAAVITLAQCGEYDRINGQSREATLYALLLQAFAYKNEALCNWMLSNENYNIDMLTYVFVVGLKEGKDVFVTTLFDALLKRHKRNETSVFLFSQLFEKVFGMIDQDMSINLEKRLHMHQFLNSKMNIASS